MDNQIITLLIVVGAGIYLLYILSKIKFAKDSEEYLLSEQAKKRNGILKRTRFGYLKLLVNHKGTEITFWSTFGNTKNPSTSYASAVLNTETPYKLQINPKNFFHRLGSKVGIEYFETNDRKFDRNFVIKGDEQFIQQVISANVRNRLWELRDKLPSIRINSKGLSISMLNPAESSQYDDFVELTLAIIENLIVHIPK
jgi:hypothetical protein